MRRAETMNKILTTLFCAVLVLTMAAEPAACFSLFRDKPGSTHDHSSLNAPKTIRSQELTEFSAAFTTSGTPVPDGKAAALCPVGRYTLILKKTPKGAYYRALCDNGTKPIDLECTVDASALKYLQSVIAKDGLARINGFSKKNSAVGEYLDLTVRYASGEKISAYAEGGISAIAGAHWDPYLYIGAFRTIAENNGHRFIK